VAKTLIDKLSSKSAYTEAYEAMVNWAENKEKSLELALRENPLRIVEPLGVTPDPWQADLLTCTDTNILTLCSRQSGKSSTIAALALKEALVYPHSEILLLSRSLRQSVELLRKVKELWRGFTGGRVHRRDAWKVKSLKKEFDETGRVIEEKGWDVAAFYGSDEVRGVREKALTHEFPNGSRITSLPGNPDTIVGFSAVTLLVIDEASRVPDSLLSVARPFLAATEQVHGRKGRLVAASTPFGKRGWFWEAYNRVMEARAKGGEEQWKLIKVTAEDCPRISKEFLANERAELGDLWYNQEFFCTFNNTINSVFSYDLIQAMVEDDNEEPLKLWFE